MRFAPVFLILGLLGAGCSNVQTPEMPGFLKPTGSTTARQLDVPGQYAGSGSSPHTPKNGEAPPPPSEDELRRTFEARARQADALWQRAEAARGDEAKADIYEDIADDYPEYERAAEARYREGVHRYGEREWMDSIQAFQSYMEVAPVNPNVPEVEEKIYRAALARLAAKGGIFAIFQTDDEALDALRYVALTFPAGRYADDALLTLGRYYQKDPEELQRAMLYFKELLIRYPNSEWSFEARRALGDTYALRDQGTPYHAGFVDRDPREEVPDDERALAHAGPVRSGLVMATEEYDKYL
ncbi:MAG: outer membrane protein assembly factor BamD, partial [Planctomycetota bacterium]|nr:outer membrane protein assembly factor BamD [Planctomycetota bacterium]